MSIHSTGLGQDEKKAAVQNSIGTPRAPPSDASLTISDFCASERISRAMYYKLKRDGKGPREMAVGSHKRISPEARADWRREREQDGTR